MAAVHTTREMFDSLVTEINSSRYDIWHTSAWATEFWWIPALSVPIYLLLVSLGKKWMETKEAYSLRSSLFVWNVALAVCSMVGTVVMLPALWETMIRKGFQYSVCYTTIHTVPLQSFFSLMFSLSKIIEFGDTFFVIMRKTPLNFLHWYHHATVSIYSWHSLAIRSAPAHWYCALNYSVHSVMYSYYVVKSTGVRMPSGVARGVTVLQLLQFVLGLLINCVAGYVYVWQGQFCHINMTNIVMGTVIYASYFVLFGDFFWKRYIVTKTKKKE